MFLNLKIFERKDVFSYLEKRGLLKQYKKAKMFLMNDDASKVRFGKRNPKGSGIWYFRINKQYRALCVFDVEGNLIVFEVDDHS
ncbi:MAG: hypothetical protein Q8P62_00155 [Candidatus Peregrinibacteria bacterium]|nr:hypothetical protein [Candidatus Peregrinibacteria bacterium]